MYRHLLVPIDGSALASRTVEQAVAFAQQSSARLTFFYAQPDFAATSHGALLHSMSPDTFSRTAAGNAQALLGKAEAAAHAHGVSCATLVTISERPHEAILSAAQTQHCDLIFMASHGRRGLKGALLGSVTQKVLQRTTVPVLVAAVEPNLPLTDEQRAIATIKDEHRSLAAVVRGAQQTLKSGLAPDFALLRAMLFYIEVFPERLHHPKEDAYLFQKLRERTNECDALIAELEQQHVAGAGQFKALRWALVAFEKGEPDGEAAFVSAIEQFAQAQWEHMGAEETLVLPAASRYLTDQDWSEIAQAFHANADPRFGAEADESFAELASRLLNLAAAAKT